MIRLSVGLSDRKRQERKRERGNESWGAVCFISIYLPSSNRKKLRFSSTNCYAVFIFFLRTKSIHFCSHVQTAALEESWAEKHGWSGHSQRPSEPPLLWCVCGTGTHKMKVKWRQFFPQRQGSCCPHTSHIAEDTCNGAYSSDHCSSSRINPS